MRKVIKFIYKKIKNNKAGFTLLEALITTAIVSIAASMSISVFMVNARSNNLQAEINNQQNVALREAERNLTKEDPEMDYKHLEKIVAQGDNNDLVNLMLNLYKDDEEYISLPNDEEKGKVLGSLIVVVAGETKEISGVRYKLFKRIASEEDFVEESTNVDENIDFTEATTESTTETTTEVITEVTTDESSTDTTMESSTEATTEATTETTTYGRNPLEEIDSGKIEGGIKNNTYPTPAETYNSWEEYYKSNMAKQYPDLAQKDNWEELWDTYWSKNSDIYIGALKDIHGDNYNRYWEELNNYKTSTKGNTSDWSKYWYDNYQKKEGEG